MDNGQQTRDNGQISFWLVALGAVAFWMLLIWAVHRDSPRTLVSFHGFIHAAIARRFLGPTPVTFPPENPFFAGHPVCYYWFFQFLAAQLVRLLGWNIFYAMEAVNLAAMGALMMVAVGLGRIVFRSTLVGVLMCYLIVAGTNPFGFIFAGLKIALHGTQQLQDNPDHLWGVVHPLYSLIRYNDVGGLYGPLLNFFLNMTSRPAALAALMWQLFCLEWTLRSHKPLAWVLLGCASALTTSFSSIIGISAGGALLVGLVVSWLWERWAHNTHRTTPDTQPAVTPLAAGLAIVAGILVAAPTYYHLLFGPSASQMRFGLFSAAGLRHLATVASSVLLLASLAVVGLLRASSDRRLFLGTLFLAAVLLMAANVAFLIPLSNESNFFHAAVVLLAVPGAASILRSKPTEGQSITRAGCAARIALVFLPTSLLLMAAYLHRPALPATFEGPCLARLPKDSDLALLYRWVQAETSPDAVFIIDPRHRVTLCGNIAEFPAMTGRVIFTEHFRHYMVEPYPDSKKRFDLAVQMVSGGELDRSGRDYLLGLNRPIYVVSYQLEDNTLMDRMQSLYGPPIFHEGDISVFKWRH
ncbi:MAG: hypothetical protein HY314_08025 [Acidobacteria bacterium]|nr:hypothetical protein [Acidobacteriota bacterium]